MIRFRVNGIPAPQGSKRHVGGGRMVESSRAVGPWREAVRAEAQRHMEVSVFWQRADVAPMSVKLVFVLHRPQGHFGTGARACTVRPSAPVYPAKRPDLDKLTRATLDGLVDGHVMADDAQIVSLNVAKVYAANGEAPGALIEVEVL